MQLPTIAPGKRFTLPRPVGSADALLLARLAPRTRRRQAAAGDLHRRAVRHQRLADELPFFEPGLRVAVFPDWETLPYDTFSPHQDLISERLATLWRVRSGEVDVVLLPATTALTRLAPPSFMAGTTFHFKQKTRLDEAGLKAQLTLAGYQHVSQVVSPGEYAVRGGLIDLFPMGSPVPYRVDLFGDEVDSIRTFDPDSQRSLYPVPEVRLLPGREFPIDEAARTAFRARWREKLEGDPTKARLYKDMGAGIASGGIEYYLPLFFEQTGTIFDYLGERRGAGAARRGGRRASSTSGPTRASATASCSTTPSGRSCRRRRSSCRPRSSSRAPSRMPCWRCAAPKPLDWARPLPDVGIDRGATEPLGRAGTAPAAARRTACCCVAESDGRRESLLELLRDHKIDVPSVDTLAEFLAGDEKVAIAAAPLAEGFHWHEPDARHVGPVHHRDRALRHHAAGAPPPQAGAGQQRRGADQGPVGAEGRRPGGAPQPRHRPLPGADQHRPRATRGASEFLHLEYADKATLYVPVAQLHLISRYTGVSAEEAPLHRLGSGQWEKARRKAAEQVRDTAAELLNLYARRAAREGFAHRFSAARLRGLRRQLRLRGNAPTSAPPSTP